MPESPDKDGSYVVWVSISLLSFALVFFWAPLSESLWLDETISLWIVSDSLSEAVTRSLSFQGQSPFYFTLLWVWKSLFGTSEFLLRSLSLLFFLIASFFLYGVARELFTKEIACLSLAPFLLHDEVLIACIGARPYALALCCYLASVYFLLKEQTGRNLLYSILLFILCFYAHYLFLVGGIVHACLLLRREESVVSRKHLLVAFAALLFSITPGLWQMLELSGRARQYSFSSLPGFFDFLLALIPISFGVYLVCALVVPWAFLKSDFKQRLDVRSQLYLILIWLIAPVALFFVHAHLSVNSLFVNRYFLWNAPALALLSGYLLSLVDSRKGRVLALIVFCIFGLGREFAREWKLEDWRAVVSQIAIEQPIDQTFVYTGLIELDDSEFLSRAENADYLRSPLLAYGYNDQVTLVPSQPTHDMNFEALQSVRMLLSNKRYAHSDGSEKTVMQGYKEFLQAQGLQIYREQSFGEIWLLEAGRSAENEKNA